MDDIWDKLDGYTKSDYLYSSDDEGHEAYFEQTEHLYISTKEFSTTEAVDNESLCSEDVEPQQEIVEEKQEIRRNIHESLVDEMKKSELHYNSETRNVQEKIDKMSAEKSEQKEELNEMQHKAQVISKSARMSATDVLSTITNSETIDHEESGQMDEYYERIRSTDTGDGPSEQDARENERKSSSSDVDLPNISPLLTPLNTGVMKSRANVARQGSMKARRKPTTVKRKSWTPGMDEFIREQDEMIVDDVQENEQGDTWVTTHPENDGEPRTGSVTPSDSSSEDEKEVVKPHLRSGVALPGLGDALKIQMTRSELKRPTALSLAKTAKDAKDNEVTKEDKLETSPRKPEWMKEMEDRKRKPRAAPQRRHKTLPARCSELDTLFEQRKQVQSTEALGPTTLEGAREASRPKSLPGEDIDPELQKMFERRKNLTPLEVEGDGGVKETERPMSFHGDQMDPELSKMFEKRKNLTPLEVEEESVDKDIERPKSFHGGQIDPELSKMFEKRKNLKPLEVDGNTSGEGAVVKEIERPNSFHGDETDSELNKMFERRKNLEPVEGRATNRDNEDDQVFKPRNVHLQNSQATELDNVFEKRKQLRPVEGIRSPQGRCDESSAVVSPSADLRQTSGIVRARFHDTKLEPFPSRGEVKVATVSEVEVRTARHVHESRRRISPETERSGAQVGRGATHASVGQLPVDGQGGPSKPPHPPTSGAQVAEFVFDGRGASHATVGRIPDQSGSSKTPPHPPTTLEHGNTRQDGAQVAEFVFDDRGASHATVCRIPANQRGQQRVSTDERHAGQETTGAQVAQFVFDGTAAASLATVGRIPVGGNQRPVQGGQAQDHGTRKTSPSRVDSYSDHVIGTPEANVLDDHVIAARSRVIDSRDVITKQAVISPTSSKSDTRNFIEQLSRKPVSGKTQTQGKSVSKPRPGDNHPEYRPTNLNIEQGKRQADKEYHLPRRSHHGDLQPHGNNIPHSQSQASPPEKPPRRNLPPINSQYPPSQGSDLRSLPHSLSYPPNSQFSNHPPLNAKTSDTRLLSHFPHSPKAPKEVRVTSPHTARVREVTSPMRDVESELRDGRRMKRRSVGNTASETMRNSGEVERSTNGVRNDVKQDSSVRLRNDEMYVNRNSDSFVSDGQHDKGTGKRMRGRSPKRSDRQKIQRVKSSDRSDAQILNRVRSPERYDNQRNRGNQNSDRLSDQKISRLQSFDTSGYQKINRIGSPERSDNHEIKGNKNHDRLTNERRVKSPERSDGQRMTRFDNPDKSNFNNRLQSSDKSGEPRLHRVRSPERLHDQRIYRVRSPDRSGDQMSSKLQHPERSNVERKSRIANAERSGTQRDDHALRERVRDSNESSSNYPVGHDILNKRNSDNGYKIDLNYKQSKTISDAIPNGIQNDKNFENRTRGMKTPTSFAQRNNILSRESVERPKPVTVTVMSLSESPVYVKSPVIGRVRSHDRDTMAYGECMVNGKVNGDVGRRAVRNERATLDVQSSESPAIPKWKQELREKKRLQKERRGENSTRQKDNIQQSGNDMAEWQKRLQGIRKTWGTEESEDPTGSNDGQTTSQGDHVTKSDVDEQNVPGFLKEFQQKKNKQNVKDDKQDTETFV